jgi:predicted enzyme involved in methoxymalonyl-ACP biosynthesis
MGKFMFDRLVEGASQQGVSRIAGVYRPAAKNAPVKELFDHMGFRRIGESEERGQGARYEFDVPGTPAITATHVRNLTVSATT